MVEMENEQLADRVHGRMRVSLERGTFKDIDAEVLSALFTRYEELAAPFGIGMVGESKRRSPVKRNGK